VAVNLRVCVCFCFFFTRASQRMIGKRAGPSCVATKLAVVGILI
jgi:hypothetical protein